MIDETDLCEECAKIGVQSKIRKYNINFEETVSICDNKMCLFPFGVPRKASLKDSSTLQKKKSVDNSMNFNAIDSLLDAPIDENQLSNLMTLLNNGASQNAEPPATVMVNLSVNAVVQPNVLDDKLETNRLMAVKDPKPCTQRVYSKQELTKEKLPRKCTNIKSVKNSTELLKNPAKKPNVSFGAVGNDKIRQSQNKNRANIKKFQIEQNNIFSYLNANLSVNRKKSKPVKSKANKCKASNNQPVNVGCNYLVRHWLNKESPRRAFPGYGDKTSISLAGTSDGRSVTDSIPPSPASLC